MNMGLDYAPKVGETASSGSLLWPIIVILIVGILAFIFVRKFFFD